MAKEIVIKLTKAGTNIGPFNIYDQFGNLIEAGVPKSILISGKGFIVDDTVTLLSINSTGKCKATVARELRPITDAEYVGVVLDRDNVACLWRHLTDHTVYNSFYGIIEPYILEYPFAYQALDEILQDVKEYDKVYKYLDTYKNISDKNAKILVDNEWFNKAVIYNGQQSSGILELTVKPVNNMKEYMLFPKFNTDSKAIIWTKVDNMYQYNTFWSLVKDKTHPLFLSSCESLSIDKIVNQENMDYSIRAYRKDTIRAKDLKIRHILDDKDDIAIVTQFIVAPAMNSYI